MCDRGKEKVVGHSTPTRKYTDTQVHRRASTPTRKYTDTQNEHREPDEKIPKINMAIESQMPAEISLPSVHDSSIVIRIGPMFFSTDTIGT